MGYILPITHYAYKNYQTRMYRGDDKPFYVKKTFPVMLEKQDAATSNLANNKINIPVKGERKKAQQDATKMLKQESDLTGKGHIINKHV